MAERQYLGEFEQWVMFAILRLQSKNHAYGNNIIKDIERRTGRHISSGSLYLTLGRLEKKGYVSTEMGSPIQERGGRAKKFFHIQEKGAAALSLSYSGLIAMTQGLSIK